MRMKPLASSGQAAFAMDVTYAQRRRRYDTQNLSANFFHQAEIGATVLYGHILREGSRISIDCRERLNVASLTAVAGVDTPTDFSEFWLAVAWGERDDYGAEGARAILQ
jgi:hypothetical protein